MGWMTETGIKGLESYVLDIRMALLAIALDRKSRLAIMAGTARLTKLHIQHGVMFSVGAWYKQLIMTISTAIGHIQMHFMAEYRFTSHFDIIHLMALDTVTFYREGGRAFVAGATTFATLHLGHAKVGIVPDRPEKRVVAVATGVHPQMFTVTEGQGAEIRDLNENVPYRMAPGAVVELSRTGIFLVVAGTT